MAAIELEVPFGDNELRFAIPAEQLLEIVLPAEGEEHHGDEIALPPEPPSEPVLPPEPPVLGLVTPEPPVPGSAVGSGSEPVPEQPSRAQILAVMNSVSAKRTSPAPA